jgi:hypothetical protein
MKHVLLCTLILTLAVLPSQAQIPQTMSYQGVLTDGAGTPVADGSHDLTFAIYTVASGGAAIWTETQTVQVTGGIFSVVLGELNALNIAFDSEYWLGVAVDGGSEFTPRQRLTAAAYSLNSQGVVDNAITAPKIASGQVVKSLNGLTDDVTLAPGANVSIVQSSDSLIIAASAEGGNTLDQAYDQGGPGAGATIDADAGAVNITGDGGLMVNGRVGIGTTNPQTDLHLWKNPVMAEASLRLQGSASNYMTILSSTTQNLLQVPANNDFVVSITSGTGEFGVSTAGLRRMSVTNSGAVGIGTTTPAADLDVNGDAVISGTVTVGDVAFSSGDDLVPLAYGTVINSNLSNASSNVTGVTYNATDERYEIRFSGFYYVATTYTTTATCLNSTRPVIITVDSLSGSLAVYLWDVSGNPTVGNFSFVIWP